MSDNTTDLKTKWEQNKALFEQLCTEQKDLYNPEFERVFKALYEIDPNQRDIYNTHWWNYDASLPEAIDTDKINQALAVVGLDEEQGARFTRYAEVTLQGKRLQQQNNTLNLEIEAPKRWQPEPSPEGWRFLPINIIAPQQFHTPITEELHRQAQQGVGLYSNTTAVAELPDEVLDELLGVEVYSVQCSFQPFLDELRRYHITGETLTQELTRDLFKYLNEIAKYIKNNTDKPEGIKNIILQAIKGLDNVPHWGLIMQILILQGLISLLENCTLTEGENGYKEAQSLHKWLTLELLCQKLVDFVHYPFGEGDLQRLYPLCDYLYNTEVGRVLQERIFNREQNSGTPTENSDQATGEVVCLPSELSTPEALAIWKQAKELGLIDEQYKWLKGLQLLACFAREMSLKLELGKGVNSDGTARVSWKPFETLFNIGKGKLRANFNDVQKTGQQPNGSELIDKIFN